MTERKTPKDLVADGNELARMFYLAHGYQVPESYRFDEAHHPQERGMWTLAVLAYAHIAQIDLNDCLAEIEDD